MDTIKRLLAALAALAIIPAAITKAVEASEIVEPGVASWFGGVITLLIIAATVSFFLGSQGGKGTKIISLLVYGMIIWSALPAIWSWLSIASPFTSEALIERKVDTDVRTADAIDPCGTGMRIANRAHRQEMESDLNKLYAQKLADLREMYRNGTITGATRETTEQTLLRVKADELREIEKMYLASDACKEEDGDSKGWFGGFAGKINMIAPSVPPGVWVILVILLSLAAIIIMIWAIGKFVPYGPLKAVIIIVVIVLGLGSFMPWMIDLIDTRGPRSTMAPTRGGGYTMPTPVAGGMGRVLEIAARKYDVPVEVAAAVCARESGCQPYPADGAQGEIGPMQIKPGTGALYGYSVEQLRDPEINVDLGVRIIAEKLALYQSSPDPLHKAILAYNGPTLAERWKDTPWSDIPPDALRGAGYDAHAYVEGVLYTIRTGVPSGRGTSLTAMASARPSAAPARKKWFRFVNPGAPARFFSGKKAGELTLEGEILANTTSRRPYDAALKWEIRELDSDQPVPVVSQRPDPDGNILCFLRKQEEVE